MIYKEKKYDLKLKELQDHYDISTKLAELIGVSRRTLLNWRSRPESISDRHRLDIDVLYCKTFLVPEWDVPGQEFEPVLLPDSMPHNESLFLPFIRKISYGTVEIETDMELEDFNRIIDEEKLPKNMDRKTFHEGLNSYNTNQRLWQRIVEKLDKIKISEEAIKSLHTSFMQGVHENAGFYSDKIRVMGRLEGVHTTHPDDIPEEVNRWVYKESEVSTLEEIAKAHAYFIMIHPFGDGNGRVGRALVLIQCLNARLMPPIFDGENRAMYYAAMEHAMKNGRYAPLVRLFHEAAKEALEGGR